jgi:hypothetical protein
LVGPVGADGDTGIAGLPGADGTDGIDGLNGIDGVNADPWYWRNAFISNSYNEGDIVTYDGSTWRRNYWYPEFDNPAVFGTPPGTDYEGTVIWDLIAVRGQDGFHGLDGLPGADGTDGQDALWNWLGNYVDGTTYIEGDIVYYEGTAYRRTGVGSVSPTPTIADDYYWEIVSLKGDDGTNGIDGAAGTPGEPGTPGLSSYQIALNNGFTGSEQDWLASLAGSTTITTNYPAFTNVLATINMTGGTVETPTAIDLTQFVNKLSSAANGRYTLADGVEGQLMYLTQQGTGAIQIRVANARINGNLDTNADLSFILYGGLITLLFTDGAWQQSGGEWTF